MTDSRSMDTPRTPVLDQAEVSLSDFGAEGPPATTATPQERPTADPVSEREKAVSDIIDGAWLSMHKGATPAVKATDVCVYYARFSSDRQHESSIERQVEGSDAYVKYHRLTVMQGGHVFADRGKSGAFVDGRDALAAMLEAASLKKFNKVLVENLDRLSRNLVDVLEIHRKLKQLGIEIHVTSGGSAGRVDDVDAVFHGMVAMLHRERMMELTGLGRWRAAMRGRNVGSAPYGYRTTGVKGELEVHEEEAEVVRRIFRLFDKGLKPLRIVQALNAEGVPSPHGKQWTVTTLLGASVSARGILRNPRYAGISVYGVSSATTMEVDGRKTVTRALRPQTDWVYVAVPEWRIIGNELWARVMLRLKSASRQDSPRERVLREKVSSRHTLLLHGNYRCQCGSRMTGYFRAMAQKRTLVCVDAGLRGTCPAGRTVSATFVEVEILREIRDHLLEPEAMDVFLDDYIRGSRELEAQTRNRRASLEKRIEELNGLIVRSFEGAEERDVAMARRAWNGERAAHEDELQALPATKAVPDVDPASITSLREQIDALILRMPFVARNEEDLVLCEVLRRLVPKVVVRRDPGEAGYRLDITVSYAGLAADHTVALEAGLPTTVRSRTCPPPTPGAPNAEERAAHNRRMIEEGTYFIGDIDWRAVEQAADELGFHPSRCLIDAVLLTLRTGISVASLPAPYGGQTMESRIRRFVKRGRWRRVRQMLEAIDSAAVAGLDTSRFAHIERNLDPPLAEAA